MAQHGSVVRGPDGLNYQLGLDGQWRPYVMSGGSAPAHSASQPYLGAAIAPPSVANNVMPMISPATTSQWASEGVQFKATPIKDARVLIPQDERIAVVPRVRSVQDIVDQGVNMPINRPVRIDIPFTAYALVGWATPSDGTALPDNLHPLATFLIEVQDSGSNLFTTEPTMARNVLGTAERPGQIGGYGYVFNRGTNLNFIITPLRPNLRISVAAWGVDFMGPANFASMNR